ncbi:MAG: DHHA1 domain-containing protein [Promethearchaeota archaeon]
MRIVTHTDFDGICCAALFLRKFGSEIEITFATVKKAKELSNRNFSVDYTCDLPKIGTSINIDHHKSNYENLIETNRLSKEDIVDPNAASATDLVYTLLQFNSDPIAAEIKQLGHLADIAQLPAEYHKLDIVLSMNSDNLDILRKISELLSEYGKQILTTQWLQENYNRVQSTYYETHNKIRNFLENFPTLPRILILDTRQVLHSKLSKEVFQPLFKRKVAVIALIYSKSTQEPVRVSFRVSKAEQPNYDVSTVAKAFGGGGHRMAAACSPKSDEIPEKLIQELEKIAISGDIIKYLHL